MKEQEKFLVITHSPQIKFGNVICHNAVVIWRRDLPDDSAFTEKEVYELRDHLQGIGIVGVVQTERPTAHITVKFKGRPLYGILARYDNYDVLPDATPDDVDLFEGTI